MKEALYYKPIKEDLIECELCPWNCKISNGKTGVCNVRKNIDGKLYSLVYNQPSAVHVDPVEKKPLYHFLPGTNTFSIGTIGCQMICRHCQNWDISRAKPDEKISRTLEPKEIVKLAKMNKCESISYTYNEPSIFIEYILDIARLAKKNKIKNIMVTNAYINKKPLKDLYKYIDAANVDLKAFTEKFYKETCGVKLQPVLDALKEIYNTNTIVEITNLIIPGLNDNLEDIEDMCKWIKTNLSEDIPMHFSRFFPYYKMEHIPITPEKTLVNAKKIAEKYLSYVYIGNMYIEKAENTYCDKCKNLLIERKGYNIIRNNLKKGGCECGKELYGVFVS